MEERTNSPVTRKIRSRDPLLRRSFQARGQPARVQVGGCSRCPWVTAGDRSFPLVLARKWHGACRSTLEGAAAGIVDFVSSKAARLRRRMRHGGVDRRA